MFNTARLAVALVSIVFTSASAQAGCVSDHAITSPLAAVTSTTAPLVEVMQYNAASTLQRAIDAETQARADLESLLELPVEWVEQSERDDALLRCELTAARVADADALLRVIPRRAVPRRATVERDLEDNAQARISR